ncbi:RMD1 family protein [Rhodoferax sp. 4810]|uniref:RMD1 family protein n=2 Tax=Thiospirillum jenense TaxID=1653858 RepID=A0A839HF37_9GAMM|nr:RMD1 family protein [Rhodoferax jenense]MBB1125848.1 RMD1 family protein [Thiospirillum jenense]
MSILPFQSDCSELKARAFLLGHYLDLRRLDQFEPLATNPVVVAVSKHGYAVLLRSGAVVLFGVHSDDEAQFIQKLRTLVKEPLDRTEHEELILMIDAERVEGIERERLILINTDIARLQVIADILGKSVLLAEQEARVAAAFDRIEPLANHLQQVGRGGSDARTLIRHIGEALAIQQDMVGRGEVGDKPEVIWERPDLERLYLNLEAEYEIRERQLALERKLALISDTAATLLDLLQNKRSLRVEWYIVILIVVEIALTLYDLFFHAAST